MAKVCPPKPEDKLYKEELMDHFKYPKHKGKMENPEFSSGHRNPSCGDNVCMEGKVFEAEDGKEVIKELCFDGSGCVISMAAASILTEHCIGKTIDYVMGLTKDDILRMVGIELGPTRMKCALLCLQTLQLGLSEFEKNKDQD